MLSTLLLRGRAADRALDPGAGELEAPSPLDHVTEIFELGRVLEEKGDTRRAQKVYRQAAALGHPEAPAALAVLMADRDQILPAARGLAASDPVTQTNASASSTATPTRATPTNGALAHDHPNVFAPECTANERRHEDVGAKLRALLAKQRDASPGGGAVSDATTHPAPGRFSVAGLLHERANLSAAEELYRRAADRGDPEALSNLGLLLELRGDLHGAEVAYRRADIRGHAAGAFNLGVLLARRGEVSAAEAAYARAQERDRGERIARMARVAVAELHEGS